MNPWDPPALSYAAIQRFYVMLEPSSAEEAWRNRRNYSALPDEQRTPGHLYRHEGDTGFIEYKSDGSGQFHAVLPAGADPNSVIVIPTVPGTTSLFEHLVGLLTRQSSITPGPEMQAMITDLEELKSSQHPLRAVRELVADRSATFPPGIEGTLAFLDQRLNWMAVAGLQSSKVTGFDVASVFLMHAITRQIAAGKDDREISEMWRMFDPSGVPSLAELVARFIRDCFGHGMGERVLSALKTLKKGGDGTLQVARDRQPEGKHFGLDLDNYYNILQQAGLRYLAAWYGYQSARQVSSITETDRSAFEKAANTAEEKLVRVNTALQYAITDLDGSRLKEKQTQLHGFLEKGLQDPADQLLFDVIDSQFFYPPWMRAVMLEKPAEK